MGVKKKSNFFTIIIVPNAESKIRKIKIHHNWLRFLFILISIALISMLVLIANVSLVSNELDNKIAELERLKELVNYKEIEIANLDAKSNEIKAKAKILEDYLAQVEDLDKVVRDITGKGGYESEITIYDKDLSANVDLKSNTDEIFYYDFADAEDLDNINKILDDLIAKAPDIGQKLAQDKQHMEDHIYKMEHTPSIWPTKGVISSLFGEYRGNGHYHGGLDIANNVGTSVNSSAAGVVIFAGRNAGFGNEVIIHHGFGYMTVYAHLNKIFVNVGDEVDKGQKIAEMGNTGYSTGPHLHYEVIVNDSQVDPLDYIP